MSPIRAARTDDIPAIMRMGRQFFDAAGWPEVTTWDEASVSATLTGLIGGAIPGALLVAERERDLVGMVAFMAFPFYFNHAATVAQEIFWWVEPGQRFGVGAALLDAFEAEGAKRGATVFIVSAVARLRSDVLARFYARRGYHAAENTFIRKI
jgi:predicted N-acetyltransferase YhbS